MDSFLHVMPPLRFMDHLERRSRASATWRSMTRQLTALCVLLIGLAARSPEAHEHVHADAAHPEHACAITLAESGFCDTAASAPEILPLEGVLELALPEPGSFVWTAPAYWLVPAHAPPSRTV